MTPQQKRKYSYRIGAIKRDPNTGSVALRTVAAASGDHAWLIATVNRGAHPADYDQVADWDDITLEDSGDHRGHKAAG
jgi:hypothetical protein